MELPNDEKLVDAIMEGGVARQKAINTIYNRKEVKTKILRFIQQNNGNLQDGEDTFHEGIIVLDRNIRESKYRQESDLNGYLFSICRFLWMNAIRKRKWEVLKDDVRTLEQADAEPAPIDVQREEYTNFLNELIMKLEERCQKILGMWQLSFSMEEIAKATGLSSAKMAAKYRYRCHQYLTKLIKDDARIESYLNDIREAWLK